MIILRFFGPHTGPLFGLLSAVLLALLPLPASSAAEAPELDWFLLGELDPLTGLAPPELQKLDGQRVRVPGFVVPLELDGATVSEFLLVPFFGACIHVPPPPANQMVHVKTGEGVELEHRMMDPVWVTGQLSIRTVQSQYGPSGFLIENMESMQPYE